MKIIAHIVY